MCSLSTGILFSSAANASSREDTGVPVNVGDSEPRKSSVGQPPDPDPVPRHVDELMTDALTSSMMTGQGMLI